MIRLVGSVVGLIASIFILNVDLYISEELHYNTLMLIAFWLIIIGINIYLLEENE